MDCHATDYHSSNCRSIDYHLTDCRLTDYHLKDCRLPIVREQFVAKRSSSCMLRLRLVIKMTSKISTGISSMDISGDLNLTLIDNKVLHVVTLY